VIVKAKIEAALQNKSVKPLLMDLVGTLEILRLGNMCR